MTTTIKSMLHQTTVSPRRFADEVRLVEGQWSAGGDYFVWLEDRNGGVLVVRDDVSETARELVADCPVSAELNYGGGDFLADRNAVFFVSGGRLWRKPIAGGEASPITPASELAASPVASPDHNWIVYVQRDEDGAECLAVVPAAGGSPPEPLVQGHDFYMQPSISPDGGHIAWVSWDHPAQPWIDSTLYLGSLGQESGGRPRLLQARAVAGGRGIAVTQPEFTRDGRALLYISDEGGWGRLAALPVPEGRQRWLTTDEAEYGLPAWKHGQRRYAISADGRFVTAVRGKKGFEQLVRIDLRDGGAAPVAELEAFTKVSQLSAAPNSDRIAFVGSAATLPPRLVVHDFVDGQTQIMARSDLVRIEASAMAKCQPVAWQTSDGQQAHGLLFPPAGRATMLSPLLVIAHGGPTSHERAGWCPEAQFFVACGFSVLKVNYRGSSGYGRDYLNRLHGSWGVCDVEDCLSGAQHLARIGAADPRRTALLGASAGGFTVLETMARYPETFAAGVVLYGISDLLDLAPKMPKFESRYLEWLLGPLPESASIYRERSPLNHVDRIRRPVALFHGSADVVVPRQQADVIASALRRNATPVEYHVYDGEGHGWSRPDTVEHFLATVASFLTRYVLEIDKE